MNADSPACSGTPDARGAPRLPGRLKQGDLVGICAPASPVKEPYLSQGEAQLASLGLRTRRARHLTARGRYTAGTPAERAADLASLASDPEVKAILCARGGYGSLELLELIPPELFERHPKIVMGASDLTALLLHLVEHAGLVSFHGPMLAADIAKGRADLAALMRLLGRPEAFGRVSAPALRALAPGQAEGGLTGGCLSLVAALVGTPFAARARGRILFLEDQAVKPYQIDRMLTQLRLAGALDGVAGIVFGEMPGCQQHPGQGYELDDVLRDLTSGLRVPVLAGLPSGHTESPAQALPLGVRARIATDPPSLVILEPAVAP